MDGNVSKEEILQDIAKLLKHKSINNSPKRSPQILVLGAPGSGCTSLSQSLSERYGFVQVSINQIIVNNITNNTKVGKIFKSCMENNEEIPDPL